MHRLRELLTFCLAAVLLASFGLTSAPAVALAAPAAQTAVQEDEIAGVYVSDVFPAASAPGLVLLMSLFPNRNAELVSYYFSNPPVIEQGTWESSEAGVVVTLAGSTARTYDQPSSETFMVAGDTLVSRGFVLHKLDTITPAQMEAADEAVMATAEATAEAGEEVTATAEITATTDAAAGEQAANDQAKSPADYQVFVTNVYPAADASGMVMLMALFPNNNMEQLSVYLGKDAILEVYQSSTLPAADSSGRVITLSLYQDGNAEMATDFLNGEPPIVETGTWEGSEKGKLTLTLTHGGDGSEYATPSVIGFAVDAGTLTAVDYDQSQWGSEGLTLHAQK